MVFTTALSSVSSVSSWMLYPVSVPDLQCTELVGEVAWLKAKDHPLGNGDHSVTNQATVVVPIQVLSVQLSGQWCRTIQRDTCSPKHSAVSNSGSSSQKITMLSEDGQWSIHNRLKLLSPRPSVESVSLDFSGLRMSSAMSSSLDSVRSCHPM